ncbi:AmmeMemoRadiSam system protein B [Candidatus Cloacimonadota bacterium]
MIMESVLAGSFFSSDPVELKEQITSFLLDAGLDTNYNQPLGIISPHAGYIYSGKCAAYGYNAIKPKDFDLAVIIAPCHRFIGFEYSVGDFETYQTPLGSAKIDNLETTALLQNRKFQFIPQAYSNENSLETQIPFLQMIKPEAKLLPILIGNQCRNNSRHLAEVLYSQFETRLDKVIFIASSDLSHYHSAETAIAMDNKLIENISNRDIDELLDNIENRFSEACGYGSIMTLLYLSEMANYNEVDILNYSHSGQINRDNTQVVGYLSSIIYK